MLCKVQPELLFTPHFHPQLTNQYNASFLMFLTVWGEAASLNDANIVWAKWLCLSGMLWLRLEALELADLSEVAEWISVARKLRETEIKQDI